MPTSLSGACRPCGSPARAKQIADGHGQRLFASGNDLNHFDLGRCNRGCPLRQHLRDRGVELLVSWTLWHQQVGIEQPGRHAWTHRWALHQEPIAMRCD